MRRVLEVDRGDARLRLDRLLVSRLPATARLSRTRLAAWIREGRVDVDSELGGGSTFTVTLPAAKRAQDV